jgi:hypothetical protein
LNCTFHVDAYEENSVAETTGDLTSERKENHFYSRLKSDIAMFRQQFAAARD